jgi:hypothetical protein
MHNSGDFGDLPVQLARWRMQYTPLPDGAWSPKDWYRLNKDSLNPSGDTLHFELAFKNVGETRLDSVPVKIILKDAQGNETIQGIQKLKTIAGGDTAILVFDKELSLPEGNYELLIEANENGSPAEQNYFNNRALLTIVVGGSTLPLWLLHFDALREGKNVRLSWKAMPNEAIKSYHLEHSVGGVFSLIGGNVKPSGTSAGLELYQFVHDFPAKGNNFYRLKMEMKNGNLEYSDIKKIVFNQSNLVMAAPNPFNAYFYIYPINRDEKWQLTIFDASGRQIRSEKGSGSKKIDLSGSAKGLYWLHWSAEKERQIIKMLKQ